MPELADRAMGATHEKLNQFKPLDALTKWLRWLYIILAIVTIIAIVSGYAQADLLSRAIRGEVVTWSEATANETRQTLIGVAQIVLSFVSSIVFLVWIYRSNKNLRSLSAGSLRFTPGWAVGWFFIPIMDLFRPYQVVKEIYKESDPGIGMMDSVSRSYSSTDVVG